MFAIASIGRRLHLSRRRRFRRWNAPAIADSAKAPVAVVDAASMFPDAGGDRSQPDPAPPEGQMLALPRSGIPTALPLVGFFFLLLPGPLRSTLFPYTTLFRSARPPCWRAR